MTRLPLVCVVLGTRPEAIKLAPVIHALRADARLRSHVCVTGQHRLLLDQALADLDVHPDTDLDLMTPDQSLGPLASRAIAELDAHLFAESPDLVLVQGDTTTALAAALAAFYRRIPVGHVEAGLRTGNPAAPWPEEVHRLLIARLATLHFAPTPRARDALLREQTPPESVFLTGNPVVDALHWTLERAERADCAAGGPLTDLLSDPAPVVLVTAHRRESFDRYLLCVCEAVAQLAGRLPGRRFLLPVHPNPTVQTQVERALGGRSLPNVILLPPLDHGSFVRVLARTALVMTDSGGVQEEAVSLGKPVLVLRALTERPEGVDCGLAEIAGPDCADIVAAATRLLECPPRPHRGMPSPFGDGRSGSRIADLCWRFLSERSGEGVS